MIRKKLLALGISAVAVTAVAGAGFAGWSFSKTANVDKNLGVNITAAYSFGTVAFATDAPDTVVLDEAGVSLTNSGTAKTEVTATWTVKNDAYEAAKTAGLTYEANVYIKDGVSPNNGLSYYVNCGSTTAEATSGKNGYTQYKFTITPAAGDISKGTDDTVVTLKFTPGLAYDTAKKPGTFVDYQAMVTAITGEASVVTDTEYNVNATAQSVIIEFKITRA